MKHVELKERGMIELCLRRMGHKDRRVLVKRDTPLGQLRGSYAIRFGHPTHEIVMTIGGHHIRDKDTVASLKLEQGTVIRVYI